MLVHLRSIDVRVCVHLLLFLRALMGKVLNREFRQFKASTTHVSKIFYTNKSNQELQQMKMYVI